MCRSSRCALTGSTKCCITAGGWPAPGRVRVVFGAPLRLTGDDYEALARQVEEAVKNLVI